MKVATSTWVRFWHIDLARELHKLGMLERIFTALPPWKVSVEAQNNQLPLSVFRSNCIMQGARRLGWKIPYFKDIFDPSLAVAETSYFSRWVARNLPHCDAYVGISGSGLHAGRRIKAQGGVYCMDRGSTQIRYADQLLQEEHRRWGLPYKSVHPWLIENEESEAEEADVITIPSTFVSNTFIQQGTPSSKLRVVPYGVSMEEFHPVDKPPARRFRLLFVGQFTVRKGAPYLLDAFQRWQHPNKELFVVGQVGNEMKEFMRGKSFSDINFVGAVPRAEVKRYMSTAHAMVLPSIEEGLALVQAQAIACGCPVIATPNTGSEDLFVDGLEGLIIPARSTKSLVEAFERLASNVNQLESMREACLVRVSKLGGWSTYCGQMVTVLKAALAQKGHS